MTRLEKEARSLFSLVMGWYPAAFRKEFGEEIQGVFEEKLAEERKAGSAHLLLVIFQELHDLAIHAIPEWIKEGKRAQHMMRFIRFMVTPNRAGRSVSILSPILLIAFLSVINPRYVFRFFSDSLGLGILAAVLLGLFLGWMNWRLPLPKADRKAFVEDLGMGSLTLFLDMLILLGPAFIILSQRAAPAMGSLAQFVGLVRWIVLGVDGVLLVVVFYLGRRRFRIFKESVV